jgi:ketosteroid isomerase-like protein
MSSMAKTWSCLRYTASNKATGKLLNVRVAHHFIVRRGLIVRFEQFVDTALVRDAMPAAREGSTPSARGR